MSSLLMTLAGGMITLVLLLALTGLVYQAVMSARDARRYPPPGHLVDVGGYRLHAHPTGEGSPVVVLESGIAASSISWSLVQPEVARFARVMSYDRAGLAWSDPAPAPRTSSRAGEELHALVAAAALSPPYVLVGHSFGGFVVLSYARRYPDELAGVVLVDPIFPEEWLDPRTERQRLLRGGAALSRVGAGLARLGVVRACLALLAGGAPSVPRAVAGTFGPAALFVLTRIVGEVQKLPSDTLPAVRSHWCRPKAFASMASHLRELPASAADVAEAPGLGDRPLIVISARGHRPDVQRKYAALAGLSSNGRHVIASTDGHWIQLDEPALVVSAIREVVAEVGRSLP